MPDKQEIVTKSKKTNLKGIDLLINFFDATASNNPNDPKITYIPKANIADMFDESILLKVGENVADGFQSDFDTMKDWIDFNERGLKLVKQEKHGKSTPWDGASNFKSPGLMKASLKFSDRASTELLRQKDIVKTAVIGKDQDGEKGKTAQRVADYSNYQLNVEMEEWREEHEKLIYKLPYDGCAFKKTFFDQRLGRPMSNIILFPDFVVNNKVKSISRLRRFSETFELSKNEITERQNQGIWRDVDLRTEVEKESEAEADQNVIFIEQQGYYDLDGDGYEEPYILTVAKESKTVVRITPRFEINNVAVKVGDQSGRLDQLIDSELLNSKGKIIRIKPTNTITKYSFLHDPDGGFLDIGYSYMLGALTQAINATANQLVDAGTLANRGGGWLAKGFRAKMGKLGFKIGEWKDTQIAPVDMQNGIFAYPSKEPSPTLFSLMNEFKSELAELSASADLSKALGANAPATTTLAMVQEQQLSAGAIILRIYRAMSAEFKKIFELNAKFLDPEEYQEVLDDKEANFENDFNLKAMNIMPVANPEISSQIQRIQLAEAELSKVELVQAAGGNIRVIIKNYYEAIGAQNIEEIFPDEEPQQQLQRLLSENPDLAELVSGEVERMDALAQAEIDREQDKEEREDAKTASEIDKNESITILNKEKAETEELTNQISTYTAAGQLDNQDLQNQQIQQDLQQPQEAVNNEQ